MRGNIRQRAKGSCTVTIELPPDPSNGKRRQAYETFKGPKRGALLRLAELQTEVHHGDYERPFRMSVGDYLREWLVGQVASTTRGNTSDGYDWYVRKYLLPKIGVVPLKACRPSRYRRCTPIWSAGA